MKSLVTRAWIWVATADQSEIRDRGSVTEETAMRVLLVAAAITAGTVIAGLILANADAIGSP